MRVTDIPLRRGMPLALLAALAAAYALVAVRYSLIPTGDGLRNAAGAVIGNDFLTFYAASVLVHAGEAIRVFDHAGLLAVEHDVAGVSALTPWGYPPTFLLFVAPLAGLAYLPALYLWLAATSLPFVWLVRRLSGLATPLVALAPPVIQNAIDGQNGALTAGLVAGGFAALSGKRPWLAGVIFGFLLYKPQLFVLAPICLLASRNFSALLALGLTGTALTVAGTAVFGLDIWLKFLAHLPEHMALVAARPALLDRFPTVFAVALGLGVDAGFAQAAQAASTLLAWGLVYWSWRRTVALFPRVLAFCAALPLSTPYLVEYDLAIWALPAALLFMRVWRGEAAPVDQLALVVLWLAPAVIWMTSLTGHNASAPLVVALSGYALHVVRRDSALAQSAATSA